jgi:hypothetical protein
LIFEKGQTAWPDHCADEAKVPEKHRTRESIRINQVSAGYLAMKCGFGIRAFYDFMENRPAGEASSALN